MKLKLKYKFMKNIAMIIQKNTINPKLRQIYYQKKIHTKYFASYYNKFIMESMLHLIHSC